MNKKTKYNNNQRINNKFLLMKQIYNDLINLVTKFQNEKYKEIIC